MLFTTLFLCYFSCTSLSHTEYEQFYYNSVSLTLCILYVVIVLTCTLTKQLLVKSRYNGSTLVEVYLQDESLV